MKKVIFISLALLQIYSYSQPVGNKVRLSLGADYITSSQIFSNPNSSDIVIRNESFEITNLFSPAIDLRYYITDDILFGISSEYIAGHGSNYIDLVEEGSGRFFRFKIEDGLIYIPVEFSVYYLMPFSTESVSFTMGGGLGYYFAEHTRKLGDNSLVNTENKNSLSLLISVGMEYFLFKDFGVGLDMKFRDPENKITSRYKNSDFIYQGRPYTIQTNESASKLNLDGISFFLALTYHF